MLLVLTSPIAAAPPVKANALDSIRLTKDELLCGQIQDKIKNKLEIRKVVRTSIQMGYDACGVIKCSIKGGGDLKAGHWRRGGSRDYQRCCFEMFYRCRS